MSFRLLNLAWFLQYLANKVVMISYARCDDDDDDVLTISYAFFTKAYFSFAGGEQKIIIENQLNSPVKTRA